MTRESLFLDEFWFDELSTGRGTAQWDLPTNQLIEHPPRLTSARAIGRAADVVGVDAYEAG
jgi:hypothetical protein